MPSEVVIKKWTSWWRLNGATRGDANGRSSTTCIYLFHNNLIMLNFCTIHKNSNAMVRKEIIFLHPASATGVIVLTSSVCVSVCVLPFSQWNGQTYGPELQHIGQVEGYIGQVRRSRSKVKFPRSKNLYMGISMELLLEIIDGDANDATEEYDCTDTAQGVFNAYAVSLLLLIVEL